MKKEESGSMDAEYMKTNRKAFHKFEKLGHYFKEITTNNKPLTER